jgi:small conductance mechanosensitive channel
MNKQDYIDKGIAIVTDYGLKILMAVVIWIIGSWAIRKIMRLVNKAMEKSKYDATLSGFLRNLIAWSLKILLLIAILSQLGIETASFAAILAAAGFAVGMSLQGSLSNFAGGVLIMIFKPFRVGDLIEAQGQLGVVKEIDIFNTKLNTLDNREVIMPNGKLSNDTIINYTSEKVRRVDLEVGVSYDADLQQTKEVLMKVLKDNPKVLDRPEPEVAVSELGEYAVNFVVRPWCKTDDYWDVYFGTVENMKKALDAAGIEIPYPHSVELQKELD